MTRSLASDGGASLAHSGCPWVARRPRALVTLGLGALLLVTAVGLAATPETRFKEATQLAQKGDYLGAIAIYGELAAAGQESGSLYWNWAHAAEARGSIGEALWALLRAREVEPGDGGVAREIERLRQAANLDRAELAPVPLAALARMARRARLPLLAVSLLVLSLVAHVVSRLARAWRWPVAVSWVSLTLGLVTAATVWLGASASPTGVVVRRGAPLCDAASPTASILVTLREGEVVPVLGSSGGYLRVQDSSGSRGWVVAEDVWRLDRAPGHVR